MATPSPYKEPNKMSIKNLVGSLAPALLQAMQGVCKTVRVLGVYTRA